jgi:hypothetical protein
VSSWAIEIGAIVKLSLGACVELTRLRSSFVDTPAPTLLNHRLYLDMCAKKLHMNVLACGLSSRACQHEA